MSLRVAANCSMLFTELPLGRRPAAARAAGFEGIELWWPFAQSVPADAEVDTFVRGIKDAGIALVALNLAAGELAAGERGLVSWPQRAAEFRDSVEVAAGIAGELGVEVCNALYGNRLAGVETSRQDTVAIENYAFACHALAASGTVVVVEALSAVAGYPLRCAADVIAVIDRVRGVDNLQLLADVYHLAVNGDDVPAVIATRAASIGHVQLADTPGRHEPGSGHLPLARWVEDLEAAGYAGWVALEYEPAEDTWTGLSRMTPFDGWTRS